MLSTIIKAVISAVLEAVFGEFQARRAEQAHRDLGAADAKAKGTEAEDAAIQKAKDARDAVDRKRAADPDPMSDDGFRRD